MAFSRRLNRIREVLLKRPYIFYFIFIFISYIFLNSVVNKTYILIPTFLEYALWFKLTYSFFNLFLIPFLVALTMNLSIRKFRDFKTIQGKGGGLTFLGIFGGLLGGACPGCLIGLFPAVLGIFGVTASLGALPLFGFEIQLISVVFLTIAIFYLTKETTCKINFDKKE